MKPRILSLTGGRTWAVFQDGKLLGVFATITEAIERSRKEN